MSWIKSTLRNSINGLLGDPEPPTESTLEDATEDIRDAMLQLLGDEGKDRFPLVTRKIRFAPDVQGLWYLRGELVASLSVLHGESASREQVEVLSDRFKGLLPKSLAPRQSRLGSSRFV